MVKNENRLYGETPAVNFACYYCPISLRLDSYVGCDFGCKYCFANSWMKRMYTAMDIHWVRNGALKSLQDRFEKESPKNGPSIEMQCTNRKVPIHWGGNCDPFPSREKELGVTYEFLKYLHDIDYPIVMSSKSDMILENKYFNLASEIPFIFQTTITQDVYPELEPKAPTVERRLETVKTLADAGIYTVVRMEPYLPTKKIKVDLPNLLDKFVEAGVRHVTMSRVRIFDNKLKEFFPKDEYADILRSPHSDRMSGSIDNGTFNMSLEMKNEVNVRGMTYGGASDVDQLLTDGGFTCCFSQEDAPKGFENVLDCGQYAMARKSRETGKPVTYRDVTSRWYPKGAFMKTIGDSKKKKDSLWRTMDSYMNGLWNNKKPRSFNIRDMIGMRIMGKDNNGDFIYQFDQGLWDAACKNKVEQQGLGDWV